jgi:class 3 adenylate cyclase
VAGREIDPTLTEPHLSNRFMTPFLDLLAERHGREWVREVCEEAGLPLAHLEDPARWVSLAFTERFTALLVRRLAGEGASPGWDDPIWQLWREAGARSIDRRYLGPLFYAVRALGSPSLVYRQIPELSARANLTTRMTLVEAGPGRVVLRVAPADASFRDAPSFCWNRIGVFERAPCIWGLPPARVRQIRCMHDPAVRGDCCEYELRFGEPRLAGVRRPVLLGALAAGAGAGLGLGLGAAPATLLPLAAMAGLAALSADLLRLHVRDRRQRDEEVHRLSDTMAEMDRRYDAVWKEQAALRRSLLVNRKIAEYLASDVVEEIVRDPEKELALGGVLKDAAVLFADIVGFTARCERMAPQQVVEELNLFFAHADREVQRTQGIVDKRIGDGLMVVFVARAPAEAPAEVRRRAVACALGMLRALDSCNAQLAARGAAPLRIRIGIAAGPLVQGNMGSQLKLEYTVIGDVVNLASRLEAQAEPGGILMERSVWEAAQAFLDDVHERRLSVRGKASEVVVVAARPPGSSG